MSYGIFTKNASLFRQILQVRNLSYEIKPSKTDHAIASEKNDRTSSPVIERSTPQVSEKQRFFGPTKSLSQPNRELLKPAHADWTSFYAKLDVEIKLRHYSPKTLRAYKGWVRQLQSFTRSKDPRLLSGSDVKDFLTHLAVKRKVSASSQNQAFNALLFFFRHIIKNEFGELKDVVRAK